MASEHRPMTLLDLAGHLSRAEDEKVRWKLVWEFLEEYRWEPAEVQPALVQDEPATTGDERWDTLLAELAEYLCAKLDLAPPFWSEDRVLWRPWSLPSRRSSVRTRSRGRLRPSASTGSTCRRGIWRPRDRWRRCPARPGRAGTCLLPG